MDGSAAVDEAASAANAAEQKFLADDPTPNAAAGVGVGKVLPAAKAMLALLRDKKEFDSDGQIPLTEVQSFFATTTLPKSPELGTFGGKPLPVSRRLLLAVMKTLMEEKETAGVFLTEVMLLFT